MFLILNVMASRYRLALYTSKVLIEQKGAIRTIRGILPMDQWWKKYFSIFIIYKLYRAYNSIIESGCYFNPFGKNNKNFLKIVSESALNIMSYNNVGRRCTLVLRHCFLLSWVWRIFGVFKDILGFKILRA